jgi:hypothetical protein
LTHVPTVPSPAHVTHVPVHAVLQQTPSAQNPLAHSAPIAHDAAIGFPGASMPMSPGRSTGVSVAGASVGAPSPCATSARMSVPASTFRCSPPPPHPATDVKPPSTQIRRSGLRNRPRRIHTPEGHRGASPPFPYSDRGMIVSTEKNSVYEFPRENS